MKPLRYARAIQHRIRDDLARTDRLAEYEVLLERARSLGYALRSLVEFDSNPDSTAPTRCMAIRHDVDIADVAGNEAFHAIEQRLGARSTFYFRLSTARAHETLIHRLLGTGFEVGYHFEEAATVAQRHRLRDREAVLRRRDEIVGLFRQNCMAFRRRWNPDLASVASHGDWLNRRLGVTNNEFLTDDILADCGLRFEAYGQRVMGRAEVYVSDVASAPARWARGYGLDDALQAARSPIYLLAHERRWHAAPLAAVRADAERAFAAVRYSVG